MQSHTNPLEPEWLKVSEALDFARIGKTYLYSQLDFNGGPIRSTLIRKRNARQGIRLVNVDSLREFIAAGEGLKPEPELEGRLK